MNEKSAQEILGERFAALPEQLREAILSVDLREELKAVADEFNLRVDQAGKLENETVLVMMGMEPTEDYANNIARELSLSEEDAQNISQAVNERIFLPIRDAMQQLGSASAEAEEEETPASMKEKAADAAARKEEEHRHEAPAPGNGPETQQQAHAERQRGVSPEEEVPEDGERDSALADLEAEVNAMDADAATPSEEPEMPSEKETGVEKEVDAVPRSEPEEEQPVAEERAVEEGTFPERGVEQRPEPAPEVPADAGMPEERGAVPEEPQQEQQEAPAAPQKTRPTADPEEGTRLSIEEIREKKQQAAAEDPYREPIE